MLTGSEELERGWRVQLKWWKQLYKKIDTSTVLICPVLTFTLIPQACYFTQMYKWFWGNGQGLFICNIHCPCTLDSWMYFWLVKHSGISNNRLCAQQEGSTIRQPPKAGVFMTLGISHHKPYWEQCFSLDEFNVFYQPFGKLFINSCFSPYNSKMQKIRFHTSSHNSDSRRANVITGKRKHR